MLYLVDFHVTSIELYVIMEMFCIYDAQYGYPLATCGYFNLHLS